MVSFDVTVIGGGMITELQILPSLYQLQRTGSVDNITICGRRSKPLRAIAGNETIKSAFPGHSFTAYPDLDTADGKLFPELYREVVADMKSRNIVYVATPDHLHFDMVRFALEQDQHVICVKPLTLTYTQANELHRLAYDRGLFIGVEYHKRLDDRVGMARLKYRAGDFGEFKLGIATLMEPWYYRNSNFQNWCTTENSDMFTYIGCHYVDQVHVITGLLPVQVSVYGSVEDYPNGNKGYLWTDARVIWENGACLSVLNGMGYPNAGAGGNSQGLWLFTQGKEAGGLIFHDDQYRGVKHSFIHKGDHPGDSYYSEPSPDYFKLVERGGEGLTPVGYGYRVIETLVQAVQRVESSDKPGHRNESISDRQAILKTIDNEGILATPANSSFNELVIEAGRLSILNGGRDVVVEYGDEPGVRFKEISEYRNQ